MGLLDQVIGNVVGQVLGGGRGGGAMSPIVKALLMLLVTKGVSGGFGNILGGDPGSTRPAGDRAPSDRGHASDPERSGPRQGDDGDLGGFGGRTTGGSGPLPQDGDYSDLAGMLDGPGDRTGGQAGGRAGERAPGAGPYARLDREPGESAGGGLGGLIESFERSGLGDLIGSWIGGGQNRAIAPDRLADALGSDTVEALSRRTGLDRSDLLDQLAQALPGVVDALTPHGRPPHPDEQRHW